MKATFLPAGEQLVIARPSDTSNQILVFCFLINIVQLRITNHVRFVLSLSTIFSFIAPSGYKCGKSYARFNIRFFHYDPQVFWFYGSHKHAVDRSPRL